MRTFFFFAILACLILGTFSDCPKHCVSCKTDPNGCDECEKGYKWSDCNKVCELDYDTQSEWTGACNTGKRQTPIDLKPLRASLCPARNKFIHDTIKTEISIKPEQTYDLKTPFADHSVVTHHIKGIQNKYKSLQFHWHAPSEHQINGENMDLELHIVHSHVAISGLLAVTGLLFKVDPQLETDIFDQLNLIPDNQAHLFTFPYYLKNKLVYYYQGSLTTPPCSEIVDWFVYTEIFPITKKNFEKLRLAINDGHSNSRKVQPLNGRVPEIIGGFCNVNTA